MTFKSVSLFISKSLDVNQTKRLTSRSTAYQLTLYSYPEILCAQNSFSRQPCIDRGVLNIDVSQPIIHKRQISASVKQVCRSRVLQAMEFPLLHPALTSLKTCNKCFSKKDTTFLTSSIPTSGVKGSLDSASLSTNFLATHQLDTDFWTGFLCTFYRQDYYSCIVCINNGVFLDLESIERTTFHVERRWIEAIRRQADLNHLTITQVVNEAFRRSFERT
jgi:hypothetical protein